MENSIFNLHAVLREKGYTETAATKVNQVLTDILVKGYHTQDGVIIGARGIKPYFKINGKSIRIFLETTEIRDEVIISHPGNTFAGCDPDKIAIGSHRVFRCPVFERDLYPEVKQLEKYTVII